MNGWRGHLAQVGWVGLVVGPRRGGLGLPGIPGLAGSVHCHFNSSVVGSYLWRVCEDSDGQGKALASSTSPHKSQIVKPGHLVFHDGGGIPQFGRIVFIIAGHDSDHSPIRYFSKAHHLEGHGQRLVAAPVAGQHGAQEVGAVGAHQLGRVVGDDLHHAAGVRGAQPDRLLLLLLGGLAHLAGGRRGGLQTAGGGAEAPAGAGICIEEQHGG